MNLVCEPVNTIVIDVDCPVNSALSYPATDQLLRSERRARKMQASAHWQAQWTAAFVSFGSTIDLVRAGSVRCAMNKWQWAIVTHDTLDFGANVLF